MSRIVVLGGLNMDLIVRTPRFASAGETLVGTLFSTIPGGKGANQAVAMSRLRADVAMIGRVGADEFGTRLLSNLANEGVHTRAVAVDHSTATGVALITVDDTGENTIIFVPGANDKTSVSDVASGLSANTGLAILVMPLEVPLDCILYAARTAKEARALVILNAAPAQPLPDTLLSNIDYLIVNEIEACLLADTGATSPLEAASTLQALGAHNVIITLGAEGSLLVEQGKPPTRIPPFTVHAIDTTAAGDAFVGAFAVALSRGLSVQEAVVSGSAAGALAVTKFGAQPSLPTHAELEAFRVTYKKD